MSLPSLIVLVRHGESEGNVKGPTDISFENKANHQFVLSEKGKEESRVTGEYLRAKYGKFDAYLCSTFVRTQETLSLMYPEVTPNIEFRLDELWRGIWHAMTEEDVDKYYPKERAISEREGWYHYRAPGGQNGTDIELMICSFLSHLREFYGDKRILIVGHGTWMIFLWRLMCGHSLADAEARYKNNKFKNASVTVMEKKNDRLVLVTDNYVPQVEPPKVTRSRMKKWYEHDSWVTPEEVEKATQDLKSFMTTDRWHGLISKLGQTQQRIKVYEWQDACDDYDVMYITGDGFVGRHSQPLEDLTEVVENFMTHDFYGARSDGGNWMMKRHPKDFLPWLESQCSFQGVPK
ncbi:MAG TPA: histidine phosphatase family protein [Candidatus Paceibacterota bacterium]